MGGRGLTPFFGVFFPSYDEPKLLPSGEARHRPEGLQQTLRTGGGEQGEAGHPDPLLHARTLQRQVHRPALQPAPGCESIAFLVDAINSIQCLFQLTAFNVLSCMSVWWMPLTAFNVY